MTFGHRLPVEHPVTSQLAPVDSSTRAAHDDLHRVFELIAELTDQLQVIVARDDALLVELRNTALLDRTVVALVTVDEAARRLSLSRSTTFKLVRNGELPSVKIGAARRVSVAALDEFARKRKPSQDTGRLRE